MPTDPVAFVRLLRGQDRVAISLRPGFTRAELDVVRSLPGRTYDAASRAWSVQGARAALAALKVAFGEAGVRLTEEKPGVDDDILEQVRAAMVVRSYSPRTRKVYLGHLRRFLLWCGGGTLQIPNDPAERAQSYILQLLERRQISRSYQNQVVSALRFLCESVLGEPRLALTIPRPRKEQRLPEVLSPGEVARMLGKARNPKHRALLMLVYSAGLRVGEVVRLKPSDLDVERTMVRVRRAKGGKDRYTLLAKRAMEAVRIYQEAYPTGPWLFPGSRPERHLTTRSVQRVVKLAAEAAGIRKNVTPHKLRHSFATHLLEGGTNLRIIQELLGHESARTTQIYTHVARSTIEAVRSPLDNLD